MDSLRVARGERCTRQQKRVRKASVSSHSNSPVKATKPRVSHFSDSEATCSSEQAEEETAHLNSGCRHRTVVGLIVIQNRGKTDALGLPTERQG